MSVVSVLVVLSVIVAALLLLAASLSAVLRRRSAQAAPSAENAPAMSEKAAQKSRKERWKTLLYSEILLKKTRAARIAYLGVTAALCIIVNMFEFRFADVQFSLTIFASVLAGILIGPVFGFIAVFLGDLVGYLVNSWGFLYMPWVGISCAAMALIAGLCMKLPFRFRGSGYAKLALTCLLTLAVCSVGINTTGMYFYYIGIGFSSRSLSLIAEHFGGKNTYFTYALVRLVFMGQLWNNLLNYALLFVTMPVLCAIKPLGIRFR